MKKIYVAPQTEAIELQAEKVLMASPGGYVDPNLGYGGGYGGGAG